MAKAKKKVQQEVVKPEEDIVASMAEGFRDKLLKIVQGGVKELVIDLMGVEMVDSVGIGVLVATHNSVSKAGGKMSVTNVSEDIYKLFKTMRLDQHFEVSPVAG